MEARKYEKSTCRLCLCTKAVLNIFDNESTLVYKIKTCCALEIERDDGLPNHICSNCIETLEIVSNFQLQCHESDKILRNKNDENFPPQINVKIEIEYEDDIIDSHVADSTEIALEYLDVKDENFCNKLENVEKTKERKKKKRVIKKTKDGKKLLKSSKTKLDHNSSLCPICGKSFEKKSSYYSHLNRHNEKSFTCTECSKVFNNNTNLKSHTAKHFSVKNMPCDECGKLFANRAYLQKHINKVHKRLNTVQCTLCMKVLANSCTLKNHMKIHTGQRDFSCDVCSRQFSSKFTLQYHLRSHSGERPYACHYCHKRFSDSKSLTDHTLLHTGETPYRCPECDKGFAQLSNMKSHFRYNHKGKDIKDYPSYRKKDNKHNNRINPECSVDVT